uniref:Retinol dehydrogenase 11 n=2 Tax=Photinus pyralis TaxID=7054 RepID=A0A1Y1MXQ9_PHOPY
MSCFSARCTSTATLVGKTAVVTGCNTGIGKCTVEDFYKRGARVIMACRSVPKAEEAKSDITKRCEGLRGIGEIEVVQLDLASLKSIRKCAEKLLQEEDHIHLLINNAGVMACPESRTVDGFEMQFGTNHLGHFLFTLILLPKIINSPPARIVNVSSVAHSFLSGALQIEDLNWTRRKYSESQAYFQSKLSNVLFTRELAKRLKDHNIHGVTTYCLHPGVIDTDLWRHVDDSFFKGAKWIFYNIVGLFIKSQDEGAQTIIYCAVDEDVKNESGLYYAECDVANSSDRSKDMASAKRLWDISFKMVKLPQDYDPFVATP